MARKIVKNIRLGHSGMTKFSVEHKKEADKPGFIDKRKKSFYKYRLHDLAGSWKMTDREANKMTRTLRKGWKEWTNQLLLILTNF